MRVTYSFRFVPEINLPWLTLLPAAVETGTVVAPALADVRAFDARLVVALTRRALARVPASLAVLP
jgi:hypothetical protein